MDPISLGAGRRFGPYVVEDRIGRGGMGAVYRARHAETGVTHALKLILASRVPTQAQKALARFKREVEVLARVDSHPGVVRIHAYGIDEGVPWYSMEHIDGDPLSARLERGPMPPREAAALLVAAADAVAHLHRCGIVHRDLKPANVLVDRAGRPRLVDFGLAYDEHEARLTHTGELLGTPAFMAPEQVSSHSRSDSDGEGGGRRDRGAIGPTTDVYGLGAVLYMALTGRPPFEGGASLNVVVAVLDDDPTPPRQHVPGIPLELEAICLQALEKDQARRYPTAAAFAADLERWLAGEQVEARPLTGLRRLLRRALPRHHRRRRRRPLAIAGVVLAVAAVAVALVADRVAARHAAERARQDELRATTAALDEAFARATAGEPEALAGAAELLARLDALGASGDDPVLAEKRAVVDGLRKIAAGDEVLLRTLRLDAPPWRAHRGAIARVLVGAGEARALATLIEREPVLLGEQAVGAAIADAVGAGTLAPSASLARALAPALDERDPARAAVLAKRLEAVLTAEGEPDLDEVSWVLTRLMPATRAMAAAPPLAPDAVERLVALARAALDDPAWTDAARLGELLEAALAFMPPGDERGGAFIMALQAFLIAASRAEDRERTSIEVGVLLQRVGGMVFELSYLAPAAGPDEELRDWLDANVRPDAAFDVSGAVVRLGILIGREATRRKAAGDRDHEARRRALDRNWRHVSALLERERARGDLPAWALSWVADEASATVDWEDDREPAVRRELLARLQQLGVAPGAKDAGEAIDALFEAAFARDGATPPDRRRPRVWRDYLHWLCSRSRRPLDDRVVDVAGESVARAAALLDTGLGRVTGAQSKALTQTASDARDVAVRLIQTDPARAEPCGVIERALGVIASASDPLHGKLEVRPFHLAALHHFRHGRATEGIAVIESGERDDATPGFLLEGARLLVAGGDDDGARAVLEASEPWVIKSQGLLADRARLWERLGDGERSARDLATIARLKEQER